MYSKGGSKGVKMTKYITFSDYARLKGVSDRTVRNWKEQGKISVTSKIINNRNTLVVIVDDEEDIIQSYSKHFEPQFEDKFQDIQKGFEPVQDAEIITDSPSYHMVSMENNTFEQLIQSIKDMAEARAESDKKTLDKTETEYFEAKAEIRKLNEEIKALGDLLTKEKIQSAQNEAELKIIQLRIKELSEKNNEKETFISTIKNDYHELKILTDNKDSEIKALYIQLDELKTKLNNEKQDYKTQMESKHNDFESIKQENIKLKEILEQEKNISKELKSKLEKYQSHWMNKL